MSNVSYPFFSFLVLIIAVACLKYSGLVVYNLIEYILTGTSEK